MFYTDTVMELLISPGNMGSMKDPDGEGTCGNSGCGDFLTIYIKVKNDVIKEINFLGFGSAAAILTGSMTTVLAKGKTLEEAQKLTEEDVIEALGGLPEIKKHCSNLGIKALRKAIEDCYNKKLLDYN